MVQMKFFKGCLPQILLGPFLNTLSHFVSKTFVLKATIVVACRIRLGLCDLFSTNRRIYHHGTKIFLQILVFCSHKTHKYLPVVILLGCFFSLQKTNYFIKFLTAKILTLENTITVHKILKK